jgi:hypothetical protein
MSSYNNTQESIVRQSQLKFVQDYLTSNGIQLPLKDVIGITNVMVDYCLQGWTKELKERVEACDKHIQSHIKVMGLID